MKVHARFQRKMRTFTSCSISALCGVSTTVRRSFRESMLSVRRIANLDLTARAQNEKRSLLLEECGRLETLYSSVAIAGGRGVLSQPLCKIAGSVRFVHVLKRRFISTTQPVSPVIGPRRCVDSRRRKHIATCCRCDERREPTPYGHSPRGKWSTVNRAPLCSSQPFSNSRRQVGSRAVLAYHEFNGAVLKGSGPLLTLAPAGTWLAASCSLSRDLTSSHRARADASLDVQVPRS